jgi:hypothetical protein
VIDFARLEKLALFGTPRERWLAVQKLLELLRLK